MKTSDIRVGGVYVNRGAGTTHREVLRIERGLAIKWYGASEPPDEQVVEFRGKNGVERLYKSAFAAWAGKRVDTKVKRVSNRHFGEPDVGPFSIGD